MTTVFRFDALPPRERYGDNLYQVWQSPYTAGCLEAVIAAAERGIASLR